MRSIRAAFAGLVLAGSAVAVAAVPAAATTKHASPTIVIGSTNFGEQVILADLYGDVLTHAGYKVQLKLNLGTRAAVEPALAAGQLGLYPDYSGSLTAFLDKTAGAAADQPATAVPILKRLLGKHGATVLNPAPAIDTNAFAVTKATAAKYHLTTIASLKAVASKLVLGGPPECTTNAYCGVGLTKTYGLHFKSFVSLDEAGPISVAALKSGRAQVVEFFSSDGNIVENGFVQLTDNKNLEPADHIIPVIRTSLATPAIVAALNKMDAALTTTALATLNAQVTFKGAKPAAVAQAWLKAAHLI
jgi:osmoprotectant transport system substrate-binding protein